MLWDRDPAAERVPKHIFRKITGDRNACSAWLLVAANPGVVKKCE
jgi:hypothetical protein